MRKVTGGVISDVFFGEEFVKKSIDGIPITSNIIILLFFSKIKPIINILFIDYVYETVTYSFKSVSEDPIILVRGILLGH